MPEYALQRQAPRRCALFGCHCPQLVDVFADIAVDLLERLEQFFNFIPGVDGNFNGFFFFKIFDHSFGDVSDLVDGAYDFLLDKVVAEQDCHREDRKSVV